MQYRHQWCSATLFFLGFLSISCVWNQKFTSVQCALAKTQLPYLPVGPRDVVGQGDLVESCMCCQRSRRHSGGPPPPPLKSPTPAPGLSQGVFFCFFFFFFLFYGFWMFDTKRHRITPIAVTQSKWQLTDYNATWCFPFKDIGLLPGLCVVLQGHDSPRSRSHHRRGSCHAAHPRSATSGSSQEIQRSVTSEKAFLPYF